MVAKTRPLDWRYVRAVYAVDESRKTGLPIRYSDYREEFDMDDDELDALFFLIAMNTNTRVNVLPIDPTAH
jgi:hypothetical protein